MKYFLIPCFFLATLSANPFESSLNIQSTKNGKISPVTSVRITTTVKNASDQPSPEATLYVRFAAREPHSDSANSILFETEKVNLPSLNPQEEKEITFEKTHLLPSIYDFVQQKWAMREYEAMIEWDGHKEITAKKGLTFTAHYYFID